MLILLEFADIIREFILYTWNWKKQTETYELNYLHKRAK